MREPDGGGVPPVVKAPAADASSTVMQHRQGANSTSNLAQPHGGNGVQTGGEGPQKADFGNGAQGGAEGNPAGSSKKKRRRRRKGRRQGSPSEQPVSALNAPASPQPQSQPARPQHQKHGRGHHSRPHNYYAALDLGTNNCRLLVAEPTKPGQFRVVDAFSRIVRLGEGLGSTGRLSDNAMRRALDALAVCSDKLDSRNLRASRLIATEACRSAENGAAFLAEVASRTGLELEVVDRETEARLAVSGCGSLVDREAKSTVLFDIGGGSSEIAVIDLAKTRSRRLADGITAWTSLPVGVVTMAERFGGEHVNEEIFADMKAYAAELLEPFSNDHGQVGGDDPSFHLIGTSGTVTTLAGIHLGLPRYDRRRVDGLWISGDDVETINNRILNWSFDERKANPCIGEDRADLVLAGCAILEAIRDVWPAKRLRVADRGLREGLLTEMMNEDGVWRSRKKRRRRPHDNNAQATTQNPGSAKPKPS